MLNNISHIALVLSLLMLNTTSFAQKNLKQSLEQQGFTFVKEIPAPQGLTGWAGHNNQHPATLFISNDQQYYIVGDLYNAKGDNLSLDAMNNYVKDAVLDEVWQSLSTATYIQDGQTTAPRVVYVFSDPNCVYCHQFWQQSRPWVDSGKVQLRHIQVGVIREKSRGQVATILSAKTPEKMFKDLNQNNAWKNLAECKNIPQQLADQIDANQALMDKYGFFSTPAVIWKDSQGKFKSQQGLPADLQQVFEK